MIDAYDDVVYRGIVYVSGGDETKYVLDVETAVRERSSVDPDGPWDGLGLLGLSRSNFVSALAVIDKHPGAILGNFDTSEEMYEPLQDGRLKFGIDQQPLLQGMLPVYLLTYASYSKQSLVNHEVETGPHFLESPPTIGEQICEESMFAICPDIPEENMHLLSSELVAVGYCFVVITLVAAATCAAWTIYFSSKSELVRVSQPQFLIALTFGVSISIVSILFMSIETEYPTIKSKYTGLLTNTTNSEIDKVNAACMAVPWLHSLGSVIVFAALFSKIWKVQMIYKAGERFRRIQVTLWDILPYALVMLTIVLALLIAWQAVDPFVWMREVKLEDYDGMALESFGECTSDKGWYFWLALLCFQLAYLSYAMFLCWRTKEIPGDFAESNYVSLCVICIFQVSVLAIPITVMVRGDTDTYYFVRAGAVFLQNFTVLGLMFAPKMWRVHTGTDRLVSVRNSSMNSTRVSQMRTGLRMSGGSFPGLFPKSDDSELKSSRQIVVSPSQEIKSRNDLISGEIGREGVSKVMSAEISAMESGGGSTREMISEEIVKDGGSGGTSTNSEVVASMKVEMDHLRKSYIELEGKEKHLRDENEILKLQIDELMMQQKSKKLSTNNNNDEDESIVEA